MHLKLGEEREMHAPWKTRELEEGVGGAWGVSFEHGEALRSLLNMCESLMMMVCRVPSPKQQFSKVAPCQT